jgi:hypothetical protein
VVCSGDSGGSSTASGQHFREAPVEGRAIGRQSDPAPKGCGGPDRLEAVRAVATAGEGNGKIMSVSYTVCADRQTRQHTHATEAGKKIKARRFKSSLVFRQNSRCGVSLSRALAGSVKHHTHMLLASKQPQATKAKAWSTLWHVRRRKPNQLPTHI